MSPSRRLAPTLALALLALPALAAAEGIDRRFEVSPGGRLEVESEGASVAITTHDGDGARIAITRGKDDEDEILHDYRVDFSQQGNTLRLELERKRQWRLLSFAIEGPEIRVELPRRFDTDVETSGGAVSVEDLDGRVDARTSGGSITLAAVGGPVTAVTSGGSIRLRSSRADADLKTSGGSILVGEVEGSIHAKTSGGSIAIERASGPVVAVTSGGSIEIEEVRGWIDASTSGGSVRAFLSEPPGADSSLRSSGGGITVTIADGIGLDIDARSSSRVSSDFEIGGRDRRRDEDELVGEINGGGPRMVLRTSGGGIRIARR